MSSTTGRLRYLGSSPVMALTSADVRRASGAAQPRLPRLRLSRRVSCTNPVTIWPLTWRFFGSGRSGLLEEVFVDTLDDERLLILYPYVVADHQAAQGLAVDQDDPGRHPVCVRDRLGREAARGDEDAPVCLRPVQRSDELLDLRPSDSPACAVSLGLNVDAI
jgi:hypothetical protein